MIKIDKNVALVDRKPLGRPCKYPLGIMEVGDSYFVGHTEDEAHGKGRVRFMNRVMATAYAYGADHGKKFVCRTVEGGIRVWRTV